MNLTRLILRSEAARDALRTKLPTRPEAVSTANYIDLLRQQARRTGQLETSLLEGAVLEANDLLAAAGCDTV